MEQEHTKYQSQFRLSVVDLATELLGFALTFATALTTKSTIMWMDAIDSAKNILECIFMVFLSWRLKKNLSYKYNYGIGKVEAFSSILGDILIIVGMGIAMAVAIQDIANPAMPSERLLLAVLLKSTNVGAGLYFFLKQVRIQKKGNSKLVQSELHKYLSRLLVDVAGFLGVLVTWIFRGSLFSCYLSPVLVLALAVCFFVVSIRHIQGSMADVLDSTLPEADQLLLMQSLTRHAEEYEEFVSLHTRRSGNHVFADINLRFSPKTSYEKIVILQKKLDEEIKEKIENIQVSLVIGE